MKLSKELDAEIRKVMKDYWDSYARGDLETWASFLPGDYRNIGTTDEEIWNSRDQIYGYTAKMADQMVDRFELRNVITEIIPYDPYFMAHEFGDLYIKVDGNWNFYSKFRLSSLLENKNGQWQILHQHGSYPDSRTKDGEAFAFDRIKRENLELRDAVRRRTAELEDKNRELGIESALERVRATAMSMSRPEDLSAAGKTIFTELKGLGFDSIRNAEIVVNNDERETVTTYHFSEYGGEEVLDIKYKENPIVKKWAEDLKKAEDVFVPVTIPQKELISWDKYRMGLGYKSDPDMAKARAVHYYSYSTGLGALSISTWQTLPDEKIKSLERFRNVFKLAYQRYLDIEKAVARAREAQVEAALERVRSRSMGMQKSDELGEVIRVVYDQFVKLNIFIEHTGFIMDYKARDDMHIWLADKNGPLSEITIPYFDSPHWNSFREAREKGKDLFTNRLDFGEKNTFYTKLFEFIPDLPREARDFYFECPGLAISTVLMDNVGLYIENFSGTPYTDEENDILRRIGKVFQQTYTRFMDLQKAEAQARESKIEAAMERVRARALAMQEPEELKAVADVMRHEMGKLGVEELETSSIYINDASPANAECWYAIKDIRDDEKSLVNDYFDLNLNDTWVGREMLKFYQSEDQNVSILMTGQPRVEWIRYCEERSVLLRGYYGEVIPDRTYHLCKFSHGAIGAATAGDITDENWNLLRRAASVFSLAYSRFKDLTQARTDLIRLKEEKQRAEDALTELKATQAQLVHAEKMASLGELTAGIAHEIQNPLNFVNNFSEVSSELIYEMREELARGSWQEAAAIADDIRQNLDKINHHGRRADAIVKGMLQHSRTSSGEKEPTDVNVMADEYLRLAFHGMRAKDKDFNAEFLLDADEHLPRVFAVAQDIGRVLLNLINNAFYACAERSRTADQEKTQGQVNGYRPAVVVMTRNLKNKIEIRVSDNGNGIPEKIRDKIFQPFFTTKPTGEGTGLGLSLSYDIITKGHGGELNVESSEGEGTTFIIKLPKN